MQGGGGGGTLLEKRCAITSAYYVRPPFEMPTNSTYVYVKNTETRLCLCLPDLNVTATLVFILQLSEMITQKMRTDGISISQVLPLFR